MCFTKLLYKKQKNKLLYYAFFFKKKIFRYLHNCCTVYSRFNSLLIVHFYRFDTYFQNKKKSVFILLSIMFFKHHHYIDHVRDLFITFIIIIIIIITFIMNLLYIHFSSEILLLPITYYIDFKFLL